MIVSPFRLRCARRLCVEAVGLVLKVIRPAFISGAFAWALTFIFTLGSPFVGASPDKQSDAAFTCVTAAVATSAHCLSILVPYALSLQKFNRLDKSSWTILHLVARFLKQTWCFYLLVQALALGAVYVIMWASDEVASAYKPHFYLACMWNTLYTAAVDEASRSIYQRETTEGLRKGHANKAPYWKRYGQAVYRAANFTCVAMIAASVVDICTAIDLLTTNVALFLFSVASVALKTVVLTIMKRIALNRASLRHGSTSLRKIYVLTAVPTVLINTQVRLVMMRSVGLNSSVLGFLLLGAFEPLVRMAKVQHFRRQMRHKGEEQVRRQSRRSSRDSLTRSNSIRPMSKSSSSERRLVQMSSSRKLMRRASIFNARQSLLHFHAAESHADMCSEYIAIMCSASIFFFLRHDPRFGWHPADDADAKDWIRTVTMVSWQVAIEMVVDFVCCVFELANGIPLHASESLGGFLSAVFTSSAIVSVSISVFLCIHALAPM
jgi:hypothetical protein